jgi:hypothetical protein
MQLQRRVGGSSRSFLLRVLVLSVLRVFVLAQHSLLAFQDSFGRPHFPSSSNNNNQKQKNENMMRAAWHCHGRNQRELVEHLVQAGIVRHPQVAQVMQLVDRKYYMKDGDDPYLDAPQSIGHGQTISGAFARVTMPWMTCSSTAAWLRMKND